MFNRGGRLLLLSLVTKAYVSLGAAFVLAPPCEPLVAPSVAAAHGSCLNRLRMGPAAPRACPPPAALSRTEPRLAFDVTLAKPMGLVLEELPTGCVFVASLAEGGSAALSRGGVLPGDRIVAVQGVPCERQGLASVMAAVASVTDTAGVTMSLSRDARVLPVNFDGGMPVAALAGEPLRDIAGMSPAMLLYVAVSA